MLPDADIYLYIFFGRSSISKFASRPDMCTWSFQPRWIIESLVEKWVLSSDQQLPACLDAHQVGSMSAREKKPCLLNKDQNVSQTIHFSISTFLSKCPSASSARKIHRSMTLHVRMLIQFAPICLYFLIDNTRHLDDVQIINHCLLFCPFVHHDLLRHLWHNISSVMRVLQVQCKYEAYLLNSVIDL